MEKRFLFSLGVLCSLIIVFFSACDGESPAIDTPTPYPDDVSIGCSVDELVLALENANPTGQTIHLASCTYEFNQGTSENIDSAGNSSGKNALPIIESPVYLYGSDNTVFKRSTAGSTDEFRFFEVEEDGDLIVEMVRFVNGNVMGTQNTGGGAILNSGGYVNCRGCEFEQNHAYRGGAYAGFAGNAVFFESQFTRNTANRGGAIISAEDTEILLGDTLLLENSVESQGGGVYAAGSITVEDGCVVENNVAGKAGGGIYVVDGSAAFSDSIFHHNQSDEAGGAIALIEIKEPVAFDNCEINHNMAGSTGLGNGGGIFVDVNVHYYDITMKNSNISENLADNSGGAVYVVGTSLRINSSEISANHAKNGGALFIAAHGGMLVSNTYLHDNSANTSGGAVINNGYCKILQSTIASNHCNGSGIITSGPGTPETHIINSTISENQSVQGPVIDFDFGLVLVFSTITNNQSGSGSAAVVGAGGTSIIKDSIIINNRDDGGVIRNCDLQSTDVLGVNWDDDSSCLDFQIHLPSDLEPLADNGGACPTHSFPITSPARNNASNCLNWYEEEISTDERGIERPQGWQCDLGAYEFEENIVRPPTVSFIETANCRLRPDSSYPAMTSFKKFEKAEVIGRNINHTWYEVVSPGLDDPCWVWVEQVKFEGDLEDVPSRPPDTTLIVEDEEETGEEEPQDTPIPPSLKKHF